VLNIIQYLTTIIKPFNTFDTSARSSYCWTSAHRNNQYSSFKCRNGKREKRS